MKVLGNGLGILLVFAAIQFTNVMDYMLIMPLGVEISRAFGIDPHRFGLIVSSYGIAAGLSGLAAGSYLSRLSRAKVLLIAYAGFAGGTLLCGLAPSCATLVAARVVTGAFGGLTAPLIMSLISEHFDERRRGSAFGIVMAGFALASVLGVPFGLHVALLSSWRLPFFIIAGLSVLVWPACLMGLRRMTRTKLPAPPSTHLPSLAARLGNRHHVELFILMITLTVAQVMIIPFLGPFLVKNAGQAEKDLPLIFGIAGAVTLITAPLIGKFSDFAGKLRTYVGLDLAAMVAVLAFTNATHLRLMVAAGLVAALMALIAGRFIVAMAIVTTQCDPEVRPSFLSFNSAFQHLASGLATFTGGLILTEAGGKLVGYSSLGWIAVVFSLLTTWLVIKRQWKHQKPIVTLVSAFFVVTLLVPLGARESQAEDFTFTQRTDLTLSGLYRHINEVGLSQYDDAVDGVGTAAVLGQAGYKNFQFEIMPEYLFHYGTGAGLAPNDPAYLSIAPPNRFLPIQWKVDSLQQQEGYVDLERFNLSYQGTAFQAYIGRRPVSLGVLKIFPVWNKFTRASPVAVGPEAMVFSQDGAGVRYQFGQFVTSLIDVQGADSTQNAQIAEGIWYGSTVEVHVLGAEWWQSPVAGLALSTNLFGATFRFEGLAIGPTDSTTIAPNVTSTSGLTYPSPQFDWRSQAGVGAEYAFNDPLSAICEGLWQQKGASSSQYYSVTSPDPFQVLRAEWYSFEQIKYKLTPLLTLSPGILDNWIDISHYVIFNADYSMNDNTSIAMTIAGPIGNAQSEFSTQTFFLPNNTSVGAPFQVSVDLHITF